MSDSEEEDYSLFGRVNIPEVNFNYLMIEHEYGKKFVKEQNKRNILENCSDFCQVVAIFYNNGKKIYNQKDYNDFKAIYPENIETSGLTLVKFKNNCTNVKIENIVETLQEQYICNICSVDHFETYCDDKIIHLYLDTESG